MINILHVDDDPADLELVKVQLKRHSQELNFIEARSAEEAEELLKEHNCDCVLCDYQMPGMDGLEFYKKLKSNGVDKPFIFLTGQGNEQLAAEALRAGADDYFTKDISLAHYNRILNSIYKLVHAHKESKLLQDAELELLLNQKFHEEVYHGLPGLFFVFKNDSGMFKSRNDNWEKISGYSKNEIDRMSVLQFFEEGHDRELARKRLHKAFVHGGSTLECAIKTKDGKKIPFYFSGKRVDIKGKSFVTGLGIDMTELEKAQKALVENEERYRVFLQKFNGISYSADLKTFNPEIMDGQIEKITGYTQEVFLRGTVNWGQLIHPDDMEIANNYFIENAKDNIDDLSCEYRIRRKDGEWRWVEDNSSVISVDTEGRTKIQGTIRDITEDKIARHDLEIKSWALDQCNDLVTVADMDGKLFFINDYGVNRLQLNREDVIGKPLSNLAKNVTTKLKLNDVFKTTVEEGKWEGKITSFNDTIGEIIVILRTFLIKSNNGYPIAVGGIAQEVEQDS